MSQGKPEETFWEAMNKSAEPVRSLPSWTKAGINLSERNFTTFRGVAEESSISINARDAAHEGD